MQNSVGETAVAAGAQHSILPDEKTASTQTSHEVRISDPSNSYCTSALFQKLTNPLSTLIKDVPVVEGNNIPSLLQFLLKANTIIEVGRISGPTIYELLYPCCRGELLSCLRQSLARGDSFDQFHEKVLHSFVPSRVLSRLRLDMYERVQKSGETLANYIQAVRDAAFVLRIKQSEAQVVARIVDGFSPTQLVRCIFHNIPESFEQLEQMMIKDRNSQCGEQCRGGGDSSSGVESDVPGSSEGFSPHRVNKAPHSGKLLKCYRCDKPGHMQRNCFSRSALRSARRQF
jgi:hypothetical protein